MVRKMALSDMLKFASMTAMILGLLSLNDEFTVETDPRSSDFAKVRDGNFRYDLLAGYQQVIRMLTQVATGQRKSTTTGKIVPLSKDVFPYDTRASVMMTFLRGKLAPIPGTAIDWLEGENVVGEDVTLKGTLIKSFVPIYLQDAGDIIKNEGAWAFGGQLAPNLFGVGVQYYKPKPLKRSKNTKTVTLK
jgi:hypothetical protein